VGNYAKPIRNLFKARTWWQEFKDEEMDKVNFMWTQIRKPMIVEQLTAKLTTEPP